MLQLVACVAGPHLPCGNVDLASFGGKESESEAWTRPICATCPCALTLAPPWHQGTPSETTQSLRLRGMRAETLHSQKTWGKHEKHINGGTTWSGSICDSWWPHLRPHYVDLCCITFLLHTVCASSLLSDLEASCQGQGIQICCSVQHDQPDNNRSQFLHVVAM